MITAALLLAAAPAYAAEYAAAAAAHESAQNAWFECIVKAAASLEPSGEPARDVADAAVASCAPLQAPVVEALTNKVALDMTDRMSLTEARLAAENARDRTTPEFVSNLTNFVAGLVMRGRATRKPAR